MLLLAAPTITANSECSEEEGWCGGDSKCCEGLTCHPYVTTCYSKQRKEEQPCIPGELRLLHASMQPHAPIP